MSPKLPTVTPRQLVRALERTSFFVHHQKGSHITLKHPDFPGNRVVVPYHNKDLKKGTLHYILDQAGLTIEQFMELL